MFNPKSLENLKPFDKMDREKLRAISIKGGKASAKARRERKEQMEMLTALIKYGDAFRTFKQLVELPDDQFYKMLDAFTAASE